MTSANIVVSQMQLWQDCNDTSTQLVDKTMGEICGNKAVVLVCGDVCAGALVLWGHFEWDSFYILLSFVKSIFLFTFADLFSSGVFDSQHLVVTNI